MITITYKPALHSVIWKFVAIIREDTTAYSHPRGLPGRCVPLNVMFRLLSPLHRKSRNEPFRKVPF
jgi:hypothetical protein